MHASPFSTQRRKTQDTPLFAAFESTPISVSKFDAHYTDTHYTDTLFDPNVSTVSIASTTRWGGEATVPPKPPVQYSPTSHCFVTSNNHHKSGYQQRRSPNINTTNAGLDVSTSSMQAASKLIESVQAELNYVSAANQAKGESIAELNELLQVSSKRQVAMEARFGEMKAQLRVMLEGKSVAQQGMSGAVHRMRVCEAEKDGLVTQRNAAVADATRLNAEMKLGELRLFSARKELERANGEKKTVEEMLWEERGGRAAAEKVRKRERKSEEQELLIEPLPATTSPAPITLLPATTSPAPITLFSLHFLTRPLQWGEMMEREKKTAEWERDQATGKIAAVELREAKARAGNAVRLQEVNERLIQMMKENEYLRGMQGTSTKERTKTWEQVD